MFRTRKRPVALMLVMSLLLNLMPVTTADAEEARRQTVQERTLNYSKGVDLIDVRQKIASTFKGNEGVPSKVFSQQAKANAKVGDCGGFVVKTDSSCRGLNIPCCGEKECSLPCTANGALAHGDNKICLEKKQISDIYGRSCCGEADCYATDMNFRKDNCGGTGVGFTQTSKGYPCCGKKDCAQAECNYKTVTSGEHGGSGKAGIECCGYTDCHLKECDNKVSTKRKEDGSEVICCGEEDCKYAECDGLRSVDSKVFPDQKNIECCGKTDCHIKECDGKVKVDSKFDPNRKDIECCGEPNCYWESCDRLTVVQTKDGLEECCGQEDCDKKACDPVIYKGMDGTDKTCCRKNEDCSAKQCSLDEFWDSFDSVRITKKYYGGMGIDGFYCAGYNFNYKCEVLDKNGRVVKGCSAVDTVEGPFLGKHVYCGSFPYDQFIGFDHNPVLNIVIPINSSCSVSMKSKLPERHYFCAVIPDHGGCSEPDIIYNIKSTDLQK